MSLPDAPPKAHETDDERYSRCARFVSNLKRLAGANDPAESNRQAMAELRGVLRDTPADRYRAARYVAPFLLENANLNDDWFYLVGGLFALHPMQQDKVTFGKAMSHLRNDSDSMDTRMLALLNTNAPALPRILRQTVSLLQARGSGLDYTQLLFDLCRWDRDRDDTRKSVQRRWAQDYFRLPSGNNTAATDDTLDNDETNGDSDED